jgi:hypothetical protein
MLHADALVLFHLDVLEHEVHAPQAAHTERVDARLPPDPAAVERDEKGRHAPAAGARVRGGKHQRHAGHRAISDPHFSSAESVTAIRARCDGLLVRGIRACISLR